MAKYEDLVGKKFNMLTVICLTDTKVHKMPGWLCKCDCGGEKIVARYHLTSNSVKSCGCKITYDSGRFEKDSHEVHSNFYSYSKANYTTSQSFVTITCPIHGDFEQRAAIHLSGSGCKKCAGIRMGAAHAISAEDFDKQAKETRNDFSYNLCDYTLSTIPMSFVCNTHGTTHKQKPTAYLAGNNACMACRGRMNSLESFVEKANEVHGLGKYNYSLVDYKTSKRNVTIICPVGHIFNQTPHNHTAGKHGCPSCGPCGFDARKDSWLYILHSDGISKIGITNRSAKVRCNSVSKSSSMSFEVIGEYKLEGQFCSDLESSLLRKYRQTYKNPTPSFEGSSECFIGLSVETIKSDITKGIEEHDKEEIRPRLRDTQNIFELQE